VAGVPGHDDEALEPGGGGMSTTHLDRGAYESDTEWLADKLYHVEQRLNRIEDDAPAEQPIRKLVPVEDFEGEGYDDEDFRIENRDMQRTGYFRALHKASNLPRATLVWVPGTDRIFPTLDQMAEAKSNFMSAEAWDFSAFAGGHLFGIPIRLA
jgi:hypothetical protein